VLNGRHWFVPVGVRPCPELQSTLQAGFEGVSHPHHIMCEQSSNETVLAILAMLCNLQYLPQPPLSCRLSTSDSHDEGQVLLGQLLLWCRE
jgi:hypothetical protein